MTDVQLPTDPCQCNDHACCEPPCPRSATHLFVTFGWDGTATRLCAGCIACWELRDDGFAVSDVEAEQYVAGLQAGG